jgi:hypothetical protein
VIGEVGRGGVVDVDDQLVEARFDVGRAVDAREQEGAGVNGRKTTRTPPSRSKLTASVPPCTFTPWKSC